MSTDDFASLFESTAATGGSGKRRLQAGDVVEGRVLAITGGSVFLDVGVQADGRMDLAEFIDRPVRVGDRLQVTVVDPRPDGPLLTLSLGRGGGSIDTSTLELARDTGTPVSGLVTKAVKGGLVVEVGGLRGFCPASQVERGYVEHLDGYVGQTLDFKVLSLEDEGRNVILSRRAHLEDRRRAREQELLAHLEVGSTVTGTVQAILKHGAVIDLGGVEGFLHVSELSRQRVERVEDVLQIGDQVTTQVLSLTPSDKGTSIRLSLKALTTGEAPSAPEKDEILEAEVIRHVAGGLIVRTAQGDGMIPLRELDLAPGADHRRAYPLGRKLQVVVMARDPVSGKLRLSVGQVANVEERKNYRDFQQGGPRSASLGNLGDVLASKLAGSLALSPDSNRASAKESSAKRSSHRPDRSPTGVRRR